MSKFFNHYKIISMCVFSILIGNSTLKTCAQDSVSHAAFVDPFICTSNDHGQTDVAAGLPFGMIKPCPDTSPHGHSGYDYSVKEIIGFSQTRFSGVGCSGTGGNILILPFLENGAGGVPKQAKYQKSTEVADPGYYSVQFENRIVTELSATRQVSYYQFTFPKSDKAGISIDLASSLAGNVSEKHQIDNGILSGKISAATACGKGQYTFYYALTIGKPKMKLDTGGSKCTFRFLTSEQEVVPVFCALSVVSSENAIKTLKKGMELPFDEVKEKARQEWNNLLNTIYVESSNDTLKRIFYTHLYHALQTPFIINDEDGQYRGSDGKIYHSDQSHFHGWSIWDTFRTKLPLLSLLYPEVYSQMMISLKELYLQGKHDWATNSEPFLTVRTEHAVIVLLEAERKGLLSFSLDEVYPQLKEEATRLPFKSPDQILESSYDLWALSEIAGDLGHRNDQLVYREKAFQYRKTWKKYFRHMNRKSDIMHGRGLYEGTLWQYRWFVPFDIDGILKMNGGKEKFEKELDYFFNHELFNIGNQPDIQVPYLYAYTNSPWKTQELVHQLLTQPTNNWYGTHGKWKAPEIRKIFTDTPDGYISEMDDDAGTMSSWFIWSALGLYPVYPGDTHLVISTPLFQKTTIDIDDKQLIIEAAGLSDSNKYIQNAKFNDRELNSCLIDFNWLLEGGKLELFMGEKPNRKWGLSELK